MFGASGCDYYGVVSLLFGFSMMISVMMIVLDTFLMNQINEYDAKKLKYNIGMFVWCWLMSIFWSIIPLFGWSKFGLEPSGTSCTVDLMNPINGYNSYIILCFIVCYLVPLIVMIVCKLRSSDVNQFQPISQSTDMNRVIKKKIFLYLKLKSTWSYVFPHK